MSPSVSVALCTFNGERFISQQVTSILTQARLPDELIVADDGSTDRTLEIVRQVWREVNAPVELTILPFIGHHGVAKNFERALLATKSELVALSDQDDVWHADRLSAAVPSFERDPLLLLQHSDARLVDEMGVPLGMSLLDALYVRGREREGIARGEAFATYIRRNIVTGATTLIRRSLVDFATPFPAGWLHDEWLAAIAAAMGHTELYPGQLIDYRQHGSNVVGVTAPSFVGRLRRMLEPRGTRYVELACRSRDLLIRLDQLEISAATRDLAADKNRFELVRSRLSPVRIARVRRVLSEWSRGSYQRLSSQGNLDVVRDLLQPR